MKFLIVAPAIPSKGGVYQLSISCLTHLKEKVSSFDNFYFLLSNSIYKQFSYKFTNVGSIKGLKSLLKIYKLQLRGFKPIFLSYLPINLFVLNHIIFLHDIQDIHMPSNFSTLQRLYRLIQYIHALLFARLILTESQSVKDDLVSKLHFPANKILVFPLYSISNAKNLCQNSTNRISSYCDKSSYNLFYPSRAFLHKNHFRLISSLYFLKINQLTTKRVRLILTVSNNSTLSKYAKLIPHSPYIEIIFTDYLNDDEICQLFQSCSAVIIPSLHESISIPALEAFHYNKPVIVSKIRDFPSQCGSGSYFFDPQSTLSISNQISQFILDSESSNTRAKYFNGNKANNFQYFTFDYVVNSLSKIL